jgi:hypothetical protein
MGSSGNDLESDIVDVTGIGLRGTAGLPKRVLNDALARILHDLECGSAAPLVQSSQPPQDK